MSECERVEWRSSINVNTTHIWIPEVEEGDGGNYTCELQYGSRLVRRTTQLKVTGDGICGIWGCIGRAALLDVVEAA
ncbi:hypothetical protein PAMP_023006 [Pampus punctatissimus]